MVSAGLGENIASVDVFSGRAQGVFEFGCKEGTVPHGDEDVVVAAHEAYGAQQGGHGDEFGAVAPRGGSNSQVDRAGSVAGGAFLRAGDDRAGAVERAAQGDGFADEQAQADGVLGEELGEAAGVGLGEREGRQVFAVSSDGLLESCAPRGARLTDKGGRVRRRGRGFGSLGLGGGTARKDTRNHDSTLRQHRLIV